MKWCKDQKWDPKRQSTASALTSQMGNRCSGRSIILSMSRNEVSLTAAKQKSKEMAPQPFDKTQQSNDFDHPAVALTMTILEMGLLPTKRHNQHQIEEFYCHTYPTTLKKELQPTGGPKSCMKSMPSSLPQGEVSYGRLCTHG
jgi:hypothetical protein